MPEELQHQIRRALEQLETTDTPHVLPTAAQVWSRMQFRLAWRPRRGDYRSQTGSLLAALYVLALLIWTTGSTWLSAGMLAVLAFAAAAVAYLFLRIARGFSVKQLRS